eukprot:scaffold37939_cov244-Amphora_coffeaeformis.AAC.3
MMMMRQRSIQVVLLTSSLLWLPVALAQDLFVDNRKYDTRLCRCERPAERFYTDGSDGYYSQWLFPRDENGFLKIGDVTIIPLNDEIQCAHLIETTSAMTQRTTSRGNGGESSGTDIFTRRELVAQESIGVKGFKKSALEYRRKQQYPFSRTEKLGSTPRATVPFWVEANFDEKPERENSLPIPFEIVGVIRTTQKPTRQLKLGTGNEDIGRIPTIQ